MMTMNFTLKTSNLTELSFLFIRELMPAYCAWVIVGVLDTLACIFLIVTLHFWKIVKPDLFVIIRAHLVIEIFQNFYYIVISIWHFKKAYFNESELTTPFECYKKVGCQVE